jgi:hypothetical protein
VYGSLPYGTQKGRPIEPHHVSSIVLVQVRHDVHRQMQFLAERRCGLHRPAFPARGQKLQAVLPEVGRQLSRPPASLDR